MTISLSGVHVTVDDVDAALDFYRDTLGLTVRNEVANGGFRWITLVTDSQPEIQIVLSQPHAGRSQEDGDILAALLAKGTLPMIQLRCDDLDATFDKIARRTVRSRHFLDSARARPRSPTAVRTRRTS